MVTGAAGYIGSHIVDYLIDTGHAVIGIDDFSTGSRTFLNPKMKFFEGNICDLGFLNHVFSELGGYTDSGVIHCAGKKFPSESVLIPSEYYAINTVGTLNLLSTMKKFNVRNLVFSSSCSVYGNSSSTAPVHEDNQVNPVSPYGRSKYFAEQIIKDETSLGWLRATSLRYFNVAGNASISAHDSSLYNLFPNILRSILDSVPFTIFGNTFATKDGSCIRDYVDVRDLSKVHAFAMSKLLQGEELLPAYNLGSAVGYSVKEVVTRAKQLIGHELMVLYAEPRSGDPASILADVTFAKRDLDWSPTYNLDDMILASWNAWLKNLSQSH